MLTMTTTSYERCTINRVWFNCCGLVDVITYDVTTPEDQPQAVKQNQV